MSASDTALAAANAKYGAGWSVAFSEVVTADNQQNSVIGISACTPPPGAVIQMSSDGSGEKDAVAPIGATIVSLGRSYDETKTAWIMPSGQVFFVEDCILAGGAAPVAMGGIIGLLLVGGLLWLVFKS